MVPMGVPEFASGWGLEGLAPKDEVMVVWLLGDTNVND